MSEFNKEYFLQKVKSTKVEDWTSGDMGESGCHCMLGHCGIDQLDWIHTEETVALSKLFDKHFNKEVGDTIDCTNIIIKMNDQGEPDKTLKGYWTKQFEKLN